MYYNINLEGNIMRLSFGEPASNDLIVQEVLQSLNTMKTDGTLAGGSLLKINGPASLPIAFVIAHAVLHIYGAVAIFDPKLQKYVVVTAHGTDYKVGDLID